MLKTILTNIADTLQYWLPALAGGIVDYMNQIQRGSKKWSIYGFLVHLVSAVFFGWLIGMAAAGLSYAPSLVAAAGGMGGFLGVRVADLVTYRFIKIDRRTSKDE